MKRFIFLFLVLGLSLSIHAQRLDHKQGEVIIELDAGMTPYDNALVSSRSLRSQPTYRQIMAEPLNLWVSKIDFAMDDEDQYLHSLRNERSIIKAQKNHLINYRRKPNDSLYNRQWQYFNMDDGGIDIDIERAWEYTTGGVTSAGDTIVVAVIDLGVNYNHPDLKDNMWINRAEIPDNGVDDDNNGYVDDYLGWSTRLQNDQIDARTSHGTEVSGIIGAKGNNEIGVSGINWDVKVMFIEGGGDEAAAIAAYSYPYIMRKRYNETNGEEGAFVVSTNASWGTDYGKAEDAPIWCSFYDSLGVQGILNCGATANANVNVDVDGDLPTACSSDYLIGVTNLNNADTKATAGYGIRSIDLGAYGSGTYNIKPNEYGSFGGTSGATPHVAGTVALLYSMDCPLLSDMSKSDPGMAALAVKDFILNGTAPNATLANITTTGGKLNVGNAIEAALSACSDECSDAYSIDIENINLYDLNVHFLANDNSNIAIRYKPTDADEWTAIENITSPYLITDIMNCTEYQIQLGVKCGNKVEYRYNRFIQTTGCCNAPLLKEEMVTDDAVTFQLDGEAIHSSYIVDYRINGEGDWLTQTINANGGTYAIPISLEDCQYIELVLKTRCDALDLLSSPSKSYKIFADCGSCGYDYCSFEGVDNNGEYISKIAIEDVFERTSGQEDQAYAFISDIPIIMVDSFNYKFTINVNYGQNEYQENAGVFIDMNYDGIFSSEERVLLLTKFTNEASEEFFLPKLSAYGSTRMRVIMMYDGVTGGCQSGDQKYGEVEDYCIEIRSKESCPTNVDFTFANETYDENTELYEVEVDDDFTAGLSFSSNGITENYILYLREESESDYQSYTSIGDQLSIQLNCGGTYEVYAESSCDDYEARTDVRTISVKCAGSTNQNELDEYIISPSPGYHFNIISDQDYEGINVYNISGQSVDIDVNHSHLGSELPKGLYIIEILNGEKRYLRKWIKL